MPPTASLILTLTLTITTTCPIIITICVPEPGPSPSPDPNPKPNRISRGVVAVAAGRAVSRRARLACPDREMSDAATDIAPLAVLDAGAFPRYHPCRQHAVPLANLDAAVQISPLTLQSNGALPLTPALHSGRSGAATRANPNYL